MIGIADVDCAVPKGSVTDRRAAAETTSVYLGVTIYPMLPNELSTDLTSLVADADRRALIIELHIQDSGDVTCYDVYPGLLRNRAKLAYNSVGAWLEGKGADSAGSSGGARHGGAASLATGNVAAIIPISARSKVR